MYFEVQVASVEGNAREDINAEALLLKDNFDEVVIKYQRKIYALLYSLSHDSALSDDLTQEVFLRAFGSRNSFRGESTLITWLRRIAVNIFLDTQNNRRNSFWRRITRTGSEIFESAFNIPDSRRSIEVALLQKEKAERTWSMVSSLSPKQQTVFVLYFGEDLTLEGIRQATGMKLNTIKSHLARAIAAIRIRVGARYAALDQ